jgi:hypothetical protein
MIQTFGNAYKQYCKQDYRSRKIVIEKQLLIAREEKYLGIEITDISLIPSDVMKFINQNI